jgi:hypothetical protein
MRMLRSTWQTVMSVPLMSRRRAKGVQEGVKAQTQHIPMEPVPLAIEDDLTQNQGNRQKPVEVQ